MPSVHDEKQYPNDPSNLTPSIALGKDGKSDPSDPSVITSVSGTPTIREDSFLQGPTGDAKVGAAAYMTSSVGLIPGQDLFIESSAITMSGTTYILLPPSASTPTLPLINGKPIARVSDGGHVFASSTVAPGDQATISGYAVSVGISDVVIDGSKYTLPTHTA